MNATNAQSLDLLCSTQTCLIVFCLPINSCCPYLFYLFKTRLQNKLSRM
ncbi:hypothetical protein KsCSTR_42960 [Candidatus Kuenenia stuttgartiensis]|uniref:Uncharacterized protein n=1 Tax=Kuenenia stuttgartiensis TaxID=174633 RepID=Q1PX76_KUEST|nr:hypothetical protein KsCSTR_42960 [Candidatus Kuenenia stuttgartiensis]CAJ71834.1 unknown protein [Candidatus Kuenenia stuttgartiensis]